MTTNLGPTGLPVFGPATEPTQTVPGAGPGAHVAPAARPAAHAGPPGYLAPTVRPVPTAPAGHLAPGRPPVPAGRATPTGTVPPGQLRPGRAVHPVPGQVGVPGYPVPAGPVGAPGRSPVPEAEPVDRAVVVLLRGRVAERLVGAGGDPQGAGEDLRARGRAVIEEVLREYTVEAVASGTSAAWSPDLRRRTAQALFDEVFGLGRLEPLLGHPGVENILVRGADYVRLQLADGSKVRGPAIADDDEDLVRQVQWWSTRPGSSSARPFSWSAPKLHMKLPGGARLAATAFVVDRPTVNVRLHRLVVDDLTGWVGRGCMTATCASFLAAAVKAEWSVVVAGPMNSGKTTLVRALCAEVPRGELVGTFETEYELFLGETGHHDEVIAWEARPGMGEIGADGRPAGEFTLAEALMDSFRFSLDRMVVGEVRGPEAAVMVKAMESGTGVLSTTHSADAASAMHKLAGCAAESGLMDTGLGLAKLSRCLNLVVQLRRRVVVGKDGTKAMRRWVSEVAVVEPGERDAVFALTHVFGPGRDGPARATGVLTPACEQLVWHGFDRAGYQAESTGEWGA
ncbi:MAG: Flp pilus assembly complex ATPase component TadA [Micrococcales bacterium]|nr:Flp pilus assembly complex ATPase component TadA [Micrococcales bacterium]